MQIFMHRLFAFRPHKPRNPLLRLGLGLLGLLLLAVLLVFGLFAGLGMLLFAALRRLRARPAPAAGEPVLEGEYTVVSKPQLSLR